jgi:hypothetical protein
MVCRRDIYDMLDMIETIFLVVLDDCDGFTGNV